MTLQILTKLSAVAQQAVDAIRTELALIERTLTARGAAGLDGIRNSLKLIEGHVATVHAAAGQATAEAVAIGDAAGTPARTGTVQIESPNLFRSPPLSAAVPAVPSTVTMSTQPETPPMNVTAPAADPVPPVTTPAAIPDTSAGTGQE